MLFGLPISAYFDIGVWYVALVWYYWYHWYISTCISLGVKGQVDIDCLDDENYRDRTTRYYFFELAIVLDHAIMFCNSGETYVLHACSWN